MKKIVMKGLKLLGISIVAEIIILFGVYGYVTKISAHTLNFSDVPQSAIVADFVESDADAIINNSSGISAAEKIIEKETQSLQSPSVTSVADKDKNKPAKSEEETPAVSEENTANQKETNSNKKENNNEGSTSTADKNTSVTKSSVQQNATAAPTQATTEATTAAPTQATTEATTPAPTEPPTQATTPAPTEPPTEATTPAPTEPPTPAPAPSAVYTNVTYKNAYSTYTYGTLEEAKASINIPILSDAEGNARANSNKTTYSGQASRGLDLINEYRGANGLGSVSYDDTIATAAMHRAAESAYADWNMTAYENGVTKRHIRPNFQKASTILDYYGLGGSYGENFGRFQETPEEILDGWKSSSAHNAVLLTGGYTRCGIGVAQDSEGYFYWVAIFM